VQIEVLSPIAAVKSFAGNRSAFPRVRVLEAPPGTSIPDLRARGFAPRALTPWRSCELCCAADWAKGFWRHKSRGEDVVEGRCRMRPPIGVVDRFLANTGHLLAPLRAGPSETLRATNRVPTALLDRYRAETGGGRFEEYLAPGAPSGRRHALLSSRDRKWHTRSTTRSQLSGSAVLYARSYAAVRLQSHADSCRLCLAPPLRQCCSFASVTCRRRRHIPTYMPTSLRSSPCSSSAGRPAKIGRSLAGAGDHCRGELTDISMNYHRSLSFVQAIALSSAVRARQGSPRLSSQAGVAVTVLEGETRWAASQDGRYKTSVLTSGNGSSRSSPRSQALWREILGTTPLGRDGRHLLQTAGSSTTPSRAGNRAPIARPHGTRR